MAATEASVDRPQALLAVNQLAELLGCSPRHCYRMADAGKLPRPIKLGSLVRWRADEIDAWVKGGCPAIRTGGR